MSYSFGIGLNAPRLQFRHMDVTGREVSASAEGDTARSERIGKLQDIRLASGARVAPPTSPVAVLAEWLAAEPLMRDSAFGRALAEKGAAVIPRMVVEAPGRPADYSAMTRRGQQPGGVTPVRDDQVAVTWQTVWLPGR
jgi:hypothetical protein